MTGRRLLCIAGGGTGGHVMPALVMAERSRASWPGLDVEFIGAERGLEAELLPGRGETVLLLRIHAVSGAGFWQRISVLGWELPAAVCRISWHWWSSRRPDLVVAVGGYASVAAALTAILLRIPLVLYEQNAVAGMVNRRLARFCRKIMLGFAEASKSLPEGKCIYTGNIVSGDISSVQRQPHDPPRLLVLGGSQGAMFLNSEVPRACRLLARKGYIFSVFHIAGERPGTIKAVRAAYREANIKAEVVGFHNQMSSFYAQGDLLIARSGAMTVSEAAAAGMPSIFIPLPGAADNHQYHNAKALARAGGASILEQGRADAIKLADVIRDHLAHPDILERMSQRARDWAPVNAWEQQSSVLSQWLGSIGATV